MYFLIVKHSFSGFLEKVDIENTQTYYLTPPELGDTVFQSFKSHTASN